MPRFETTIDIAAPPAQVWSVLSRVTDWPLWTPTMRSVTPTNPQATGDPVPGQSYKVVQPKLRPAIYTITSLTPQKEFTWQTRQPGLRIIAGHRITGEANGTRVTLTIEFTGLLAGLVWPFVRRITRDYLTQEARSLKARVENTNPEPGLTPLVQA